MGSLSTRIAPVSGPVNAGGSGATITGLTGNLTSARLTMLGQGKIAFYSLRDGSEEIGVMNADGSEQTRLTSNTTRDYLPVWSPDGGKIAFCSGWIGQRDIYVMNADGTGRTQLTTHPADDHAPAWGKGMTLNLVGAGGLLANSAGGFLYARCGETPRSFLVFDAGSSVSLRLSAFTEQSNLSNAVFHLTADSITSMKMVDLQNPRLVVVTLVGAGGVPPGAKAMLISYSTSTGRLDAVIPYTRSRSGGAPTVHEEGGIQVLRGEFPAVLDAQGNNLAPNGASEVRIDIRTGKVEVR